MTTKKKVTRKQKSKAAKLFETQSLRQLISIQTEINNENVKRLENGRTISIDQLPDCSHKVRLALCVANVKEARIVVVALRNANDTWQAYAGYPDARDLAPIVKDFSFDLPWFCENIRDSHQVAMMGDKLEKEAAIKLFPDWDGSKYKE